jgi:hypothetical protein
VPGWVLIRPLADLLLAVVERQDPGGHAGGILAVLVERGGHDEVLPGGNVFACVDLLLREADEVVDVMQPVVLHVQGVPAEPRPVREQHAFRAGSGDVDQRAGPSTGILACPLSEPAAASSS